MRQSGSSLDPRQAQVAMIRSAAWPPWTRGSPVAHHRWRQASVPRRCALRLRLRLRCVLSCEQPCSCSSCRRGVPKKLAEAAFYGLVVGIFYQRDRNYSLDSVALQDTLGDSSGTDLGRSRKNDKRGRCSDAWEDLHGETLPWSRWRRRHPRRAGAQLVHAPRELALGGAELVAAGAVDGVDRDHLRRQPLVGAQQPL